MLSVLLFFALRPWVGDSGLLTLISAPPQVDLGQNERVCAGAQHSGSGSMRY